MTELIIPPHGRHTARQKFDWSREEWVEVAPYDFSVGTRPVPSSEGTRGMNDAALALKEVPHAG